MRPRPAAAVLLVLALAGCSSSEPAASSSPTETATPAATAGIVVPASDEAHAVADMLARTANYSALDADPYEGAWDPPLEEEGFEAIADAGFTAVRIPVRFSAHQALSPPYAVDEGYLERLDWVIDQALSRGLAVIIDNRYSGSYTHGDLDLLFSDPEAGLPRLEAAWAQVAERYADQPESVVFQIQNEPHDNLDAVWNDAFARLLGIVRETNPDRVVIVNAPNYSVPWALSELDLPPDDHLIVDIHHYVPFDFTHQGATWVDPIPPIGAVWPPTTVRLSSRWGDWSWDTERTLTADGWAIRATAPWAGVTLHALAPVEGATAISLTTAQPAEFTLACWYGAVDDAPSAYVATEAGVPVTIEVAECGMTGPDLVEIRFQLGPDASADFTVTGLEVETLDGPFSLFVTPEEEILEPLDYAAVWSEAHGDVPIIVGEFGCSGFGDEVSRAAWLRAVRVAIEERGFSWAFWEMQGTWGFWTPDDGIADTSILDALFGG